MHDVKPLSLVQIIEWELGTACNLGRAHAACPNMHPDRYRHLDIANELTDGLIVDCCDEAYTDLGFTGFIGWAYYNEPTLTSERMFPLMDTIRQRTPQARFILWTNGTRIPEKPIQFEQFEQIFVSDYGAESQRGLDRLKAWHIPAWSIPNAALDGRIGDLGMVSDGKPCMRPFVELIVDHYGNTHLCCYDWRGRTTWGNVFDDTFTDLAERWYAMLPGIAGRAMNGQAPQVCSTCPHKWDSVQLHDSRILGRVRRWREQIGGQ